MTNDKKLSLEAEQLVDRLARVLSSQKKLGGDSYPLSLGRLVALAEISLKTVSDLANNKLFKDRIVSARKIDKKKPDHDIPVALSEDTEQLATSSFTLEYLLNLRRTAKIRAFSVTELAGKLASSSVPAKDIRGLFKNHINQQIQRGLSGSHKVAWVHCRTPKLFLLSDVNPDKALVSGQRDFPPQIAPLATGSGDRKTAVNTSCDLKSFYQSFDLAFDRINRTDGGHNFVSLVELRRELGTFNREAFDQYLHDLRLTGRYTLIAAQGRSGGLKAEELEAAINEAGKLLLYVSRIRG
ncbi:MAG: hypothetical protein OEV64_02840 [Desulfobulbaceae bacterium]|nr:hypothetical protein [Desulfobulbaceae bacterium]